MVKDLKVDENGDLIIDPLTHDLVMIDGDDEILQRIKATLDIRYGEMKNLAPEIGADYQNFLGKNFNEEGASADMRAAITAQVPEVENVTSIKFKKLPNRRLEVDFTATIKHEDNSTSKVEGGYEVGT
ncbi:hypothetical protein J2Z60_001079 [Lactobacillus colini]|uniref:DUF2634 domain-containing protein n=1 Tax=Lactobacillus colini TaxID=1819254 RepID=A0ABS4MEU6_9LACO|nr:DUF2634 domain-containing protein [Lactobacillus colini]MBP2057904.1 hypothetical protein [Lactobacillus colini]